MVVGRQGGRSKGESISKWTGEKEEGKAVRLVTDLGQLEYV
jgi:hypothetical protein